jgi:hypothetical protein
MIEWSSFLLVAMASVAFTLVIVLVFSLGIRFLASSQAQLPLIHSGEIKAIRKEALFRMASYMLFALSGLALMFGIWLIIPGFHR